MLMQMVTLMDSNDYSSARIDERLITLFSTSLLLFVHATSLITAQEVENEAEFEYKEKSKKAPKFWGGLKKEWEACKAVGDHNQSPIDISDKNVQVIAKTADLVINYKPADAEVKNRSHDIAVYWIGDPGSVKIDGSDYVLQQSHWHSPSEHTINSIRYDMELHMVHQDKNDKVAVVGQMYKIGKPDDFLSKLGTVSEDQVKLLRDAVNDYADENARPVQALNRRKIQLYRQDAS